jgi:protein O-GlcNAc transferase
MTKLAIRPDYPEALYNRGNALHAVNRGQEARANYARALVLKPDFTQARFTACMAELPILYTDEAEISAQRLAYEQQLRTLHEEAKARGFSLQEM